MRIDLPFFSLYIIYEGKLKFDVSITPGSGQFEVMESGTVVVKGNIQAFTDAVPPIPIKKGASQPDEPLLTAAEIYRELRLRGYHYGKTFQGITEARINGSIRLCVIGKL